MNIRSVEKFILYGYKGKGGNVLKKYVYSAVKWFFGAMFFLSLGFIVLSAEEGRAFYAFTREDIDLLPYVCVVLSLIPIVVIITIVYNKWWMGKLHKYTEYELQLKSTRAGIIAATGGPSVFILSRLFPALRIDTNESAFIASIFLGLCFLAIVTLRLYQIYLIRKHQLDFRDYRLRVPKLQHPK